MNANSTSRYPVLRTIQTRETLKIARKKGKVALKVSLTSAGESVRERGSERDGSNKICVYYTRTVQLAVLTAHNLWRKT